jgi:putative transposase
MPPCARSSRRVLDEIARDGARRMLAAALEAEVDGYVAAFAGQVDAAGRRLVVRDGHARPRQVTTVAGAVEVVAPRVNDQRVDEATGERCRFRSQILLAYDLGGGCCQDVERAPERPVSGSTC